MKNIIYKTKQQSLKALSIIGLLASCSSNYANLSLDKTYMMELDLEIDGVKAKGVYEAPIKKESYKINISLQEKPHVVKINSCHREVVLRDPGKYFTFIYNPVPSLETGGGCFLEISAFTESGYNQWGAVDFNNGETLVGILGCNGMGYIYKGSSVCQSRVGLVQTITFNSNVLVYAPDRCPKMKKVTEKTFTFDMGKDKCIYLFVDENKAEHRLTTFGYDEVLLK